MAKKKYEEANIQAIADTIRDKTGTDNTYDTSEMASGVNEVYEAGKKAEYENFWDNFNYFSIWDYHYAGTGWNKENFRPTEDIILSVRTFARHGWNRDGIYDLVEHLKSLGVKIIKMTSGRETFIYCTMFNRLPEIDATKATYFLDTFYGMIRLVTIDKLIINTDVVTNWSADIFGNCTRLVNINMEGSVLGKSISFLWCPLSVESIKSIILCLKDFSGTTSEYTTTITFKTSAFEALEAEGATAEYNGTPCTWAELIDNLKWNLVKA